MVSYGSGSHRTTVLNGVSFALTRGKSMGLVGESGSGKSTIAKSLVGLVSPSGGQLEIFDSTGQVVRQSDPVSKRRKVIQLIPQNPYSSLDPRIPIAASIAEAIDPQKASVKRHKSEIVEWLNLVGLDSDAGEKLPSQFSGGQRQRIAIARALCIHPDIVIADEITSALDVSTQADTLKLLDKLHDEFEFTMLFISHNLAVVRHVCDDVFVLYRGNIVEQGTISEVFENPQSEYTKTLINSSPNAPGFHLD